MKKSGNLWTWGLIAVALGAAVVFGVREGVVQLESDNSHGVESHMLSVGDGMILSWMIDRPAAIFGISGVMGDTYFDIHNEGGEWKIKGGQVEDRG